MIAQAVSDLSPRIEVTTPTCVDAARFLMDGLWQSDTIWAQLALEGNEWLTEARVDKVVALKISPEAAALLPPRLKYRLAKACPTDG